MFKLGDMLRNNLHSTPDTAADTAFADAVDYMGGIDAEVFKAGDARQKLPDLREFAENGGAAVIADRGKIADAEDTTLLVSVATLTKLIHTVIIGEQARYADREPASALLAGLLPTGDFQGDIAVERLPGDHPGLGLEDIKITGSAD